MAIETRGSLILTGKLPSKVFKKIKDRLTAIGQPAKADEIEKVALLYKQFLLDGVFNPFQDDDATYAQSVLKWSSQFADQYAISRAIVSGSKVLWQQGMNGTPYDTLEARRQWWLKSLRRNYMVEFLIKAAKKAGLTVCTSGYSQANYEKLARPPKRVKRKWTWEDRKLPFKIRIFGVIEVSEPNSDGLVFIKCTEQVRDRDQAARLLPPGMHPIIWFTQSPYHSVGVYKENHWPVMGIQGVQVKPVIHRIKLLATHKIPQDSIDWIDEVIGRLL